MNLGDVTLQGAERSYVLNFGTNTACRLEDALGKSYGALWDELRQAQPSVRLIRALIKAALVDPKADGLTDEQIGAIVDDIGGWEVIHAGLILEPTHA